MITSQLKNDVDRLWTEFWTGGIANPLTVIEQISFLLFMRLLDMDEARHEKMASRLGKSPHKNFSQSQQNLRWKSWRNLGGDEMLRHVRDEVFPHLRDLGAKGSTFGEYMKDAQLFVQKPSLLVSAVEQVEKLPLGNADVKGDLYEYMLGKLTTAGINGQFRTPRHIIRLIVELLQPKPTDTIGDPACGTAGFLVGVMQYLREQYSTPELVETLPDGSKSYPGDRLDPYREHIQGGMFHGFDFDVTMLRIAAMNLMLHGVDNPEIHYMDTLSKQFPEKFAPVADAESRPGAGLDIVLANPPFKGSLAEDDIHPSLLRRVKTKKTELLFVALILRMLKTGGRSATIVPDGVLFGSSKGHLGLRQHLIDENQLEGVISLPSGVFKPYAGVSTGILVFTKGGQTKDVFFYDVEADGLSLDDKRQEIKENDLPDVLAQFHRSRAGTNPALMKDRTAKAFMVPAADIRAQKYDLSINRYREHKMAAVAYEPPRVILARMKALEDDIRAELNELDTLI
jgi:type I restriction enzyme M protein